MSVNVLVEDEVAPGFTGHDVECILYLEDPLHTCINRDGDPVRVGQACWANARPQVLRRIDVVTFDVPSANKWWGVAS